MRTASDPRLRGRLRGIAISGSVLCLALSAINISRTIQDEHADLTIPDPESPELRDARSLLAWRQSPEVRAALEATLDSNRLPTTLPHTPPLATSIGATDRSNAGTASSGPEDLLKSVLLMEAQRSASLQAWVVGQNMVASERDALVKQHLARIDQIATRFPAIRRGTPSFLFEFEAAFEAIRSELSTITITTRRVGSPYSGSEQSGSVHWSSEVAAIQDAINGLRLADRPYEAGLAAERATSAFLALRQAIDSVPRAPSVELPRIPVPSYAPRFGR
jgi:hypothetical protein